MQPGNKIRRIGRAWPAAVWIAAAALAAPAAGEDWPTYKHDNGRTCVTGESLRLPLGEEWKKASPMRPQPAWEGPAKWDAYHGAKGLKSMRNFDPVFHVTAAGGRVFYGSSVDDSAHCLDAATGNAVWTFTTDAPVRIPPAVHEGKAYFGSDDGFAYCVSADTGKLIWKHRPPADERTIPSNGKMISIHPVRTGVLVADGKAYFAASLLPWRESWLCALDAKTGSAKGAGLFEVRLTGVTLQGPLLASKDFLFVMQGRSAPLVFSRANGRAAGSLGKGGRGGVYAVMTPDNKIAYGFGNRTGEIYVHNAASRAEICKFPGARRILIAPGLCYLYKPGELQAGNLLGKKTGPAEVRKLHREYVNAQVAARQARQAAAAEKDPARKAQLEKQALDAEKKFEAAKAALKAAKEALAAGAGWKIKAPVVHAMMLAGQMLVVGADDKVLALDAKTGKELWSAPVSGDAHGLAAANGRLFVSTDLGTIHCFAAK